MSILVVGEYPYKSELREGGPFTGGLWRFFKKNMRDAGLSPNSYDYVNVINSPPPYGNSIFGFTVKDSKYGISGFPYLARGAYVKPQYRHDIDQLYSTIRRAKANLVLAVGDLACWALLHEQTAEAVRGRITTGIDRIQNQKILACYAPRTIMSEENLRPILRADLQKALRESAYPEIRRPQRFLHIRPTLADLDEFYEKYISKSPINSVDIETKGDMITCIGFAPTKDRCLIIPFYDAEKPNGNYWEHPWHEKRAWHFVNKMLNLPNCHILGQNFSYDTQRLLRHMGIAVRSWTDDTMLMHHAMQPEFKKSLGFMSSIHTDEVAWKHLAKRKAADRGGKKEDE